MGEKKYYERYDISPSEFRYKHFGDRSLDNFYLVKDKKRQFHRQRNVSVEDCYYAPTTYETPLLYELCSLYNTAYMNQRKKRMANLYQIELRTLSHSKMWSMHNSTFQKHVIYDVWDSRDIWYDLIPAQRMAFFR